MAQTNKVVCFGFPKEAALYFEEVLPLDFGFGWFALFDGERDSIASESKELGIPLQGGELSQRIVESLMPNTGAAYEAYCNNLLASTWIPLALIFGKLGSPDDFQAHLSQGTFAGAMQMISDEGGISLKDAVDQVRSGDLRPDQMAMTIRPKIKEFIRKSGFEGSPGWLTLGSINEDRGSVRSESSTCYATSIKGLGLIDATKCSWEQVLEFRKDRASMLALRRFRSFFSDNFAGKDPVYVSDKLHVLVDEYERSSKLWGFELADKTISAVVTNENVVGTALATLAPALAGAPLTVAAACGSVITVGRCAVAFSRVVVTSLSTRNDNPMNFLTKLSHLPDSYVS